MHKPRKESLVFDPQLVSDLYCVMANHYPCNRQARVHANNVLKAPESLRAFDMPELHNENALSWQTSAKQLQHLLLHSTIEACAADLHNAERLSWQSRVAQGQAQEAQEVTDTAQASAQKLERQLLQVFEGNHCLDVLLNTLRSGANCIATWRNGRILEPFTCI